MQRKGGKYLKEIGGYMELDTYSLPMMHNNAVALNCGRNALAYLIEVKNIRKILLPYFLCDSVKNICEKCDLKIRYYHTDFNFKPVFDQIEQDEWIYIVNYYGQLEKEYIKEIRRKFDNVIIDNAQAYFADPIENTDTIYTCRKFIGVCDGAFLYTDKLIDRKLDTDESFDRMNFVLGRFERNGSEFYNESSINNKFFNDEPIKYMSKLTRNLLHAVDYKKIEEKRRNNFNLLHKNLCDYNELDLRECIGPYMYPLLVHNAENIRKGLIKKKIYIPILWPNVLDELDENALEFYFAKNILPLPCDQRYDRDDMSVVVKEIKNMLCEEGL